MSKKIYKGGKFKWCDYHKSCNIYSFFHSPTRITKIILLVVIHQYIKQSVIKQKSVEENGLGFEVQGIGRYVHEQVIVHFLGEPKG